MAGKRKRAHGAEAAGAGKGKSASQSASQSQSKRAKASAAGAKSGGRQADGQAPVAAVANSNWLALKAKIQRQDAKFRSGDDKKRDLDVKAHKQRAKEQRLARRQQAKSAEWVDNAAVVAMDCEMVGVGLSGKTSVLARCSVVDYDGRVLYDKHVRPVEKVTDFRTHVSGIRARSLKKAIPFAQCIKEVGKLLDGKIVVGHALKNDFSALMFTPPKNMIRDTAHYRPYMRRKVNGTVRIEPRVAIALLTTDAFCRYRNSSPSRSSILPRSFSGSRSRAASTTRCVILVTRDFFLLDHHLILTLPPCTGRGRSSNLAAVQARAVRMGEVFAHQQERRHTRGRGSSGPQVDRGRRQGQAEAGNRQGDG